MGVTPDLFGRQSQHEKKNTETFRGTVRDMHARFGDRIFGFGPFQVVFACGFWPRAHGRLVF